MVKGRQENGGFAREISVCILLIILSVVFLAVGEAQAIILHAGSSGPTEPDRPADGVIGRWGTKYASCVAIGRQYVITTRHQPDLPGVDVIDTPVIIEGRTYSISEIWEYSTEGKYNL